MGFRRVLLVAAFFVPLPCRAADSPREFLAALNSLQLDTQHVYTVTSKDRVVIHKGDAVISLQDGQLAFFEPFEGRITGFTFTGIGHVLSLPRDPVEKQQLARFLGAPVLDQQFLSAYVRFTDDTGGELLEELRRADLTPAADNRFRTMWQASLERLNISHSLRILAEKVSPSVPHFFHAGLDGAVTGPFDILLDPTRMDNFILGQPRTVGASTFYDVWASYALPGAVPPAAAFDATRYRVDTLIHPDDSLDGTASIEFHALSGPQAFLTVQLSRTLKVAGVTGENGEDLPYFQNQGLTQQEIHSRGQDTLVVFLHKTPAPGARFTVNFRYFGNVIEDAGNGVLFVGARESWYPHFGDASEFANYELTFHWPRRLRLVATGTKSAEHEEGEMRVATWTTEIPVTQTGFNLGEYASNSLASENHTIDVYANKQLEEFLRQRLSREEAAVDAAQNPLMSKPPAGANIAAIPPSPANLLKRLARDVDASIRFDEIYSGPFPFRNLEVSQIPGAFGQGWPGLLYISTLSFLPEEAQARAGLSETGRSFFTNVVPFHEVAHQWWGNVVGWSSYRDQWINEAIAEYLALLFADSQKGSEHALNGWLDHYRKRLVTKMEGEDRDPADIGPVSIGTRLSSSRSPDA